MADFIAESIARLEVTLAALQSMKYDNMTQQERSMHRANIMDLEKLRQMYLAQQARTSGTRPVIRDINLTEPAPGEVMASEAENG